MRVRAANREALLHLYDAVGEAFGDRRKVADRTYLADTQGLVFVLDPFSIPGVVSELRGDRSALAARTRRSSNPSTPT